MKNLNAYDLSALKVLIVDDNPHMRHLIRQLVGAFGIRHKREAEDGAEALKCLNTFQADFAICDWNMAPLDGIDFTRIVRNAQDTLNPFLPIIMLSGHTEQHRIEEARDAGVDEYLSKPVSALALYERIVCIIEKRRPFIHTDSYWGPDRRRHHNFNFYKGPERRTSTGLDGVPPPNVLTHVEMTNHIF